MKWYMGKKVKRRLTPGSPIVLFLNISWEVSKSHRGFHCVRLPGRKVEREL